ncbi:MAG: hypothetical protein AB1938_28615 [Myxococcota bacterium]
MSRAQALLQLRVEIELDPGNVELRLKLGELLQKEDDLPGAAATYLEVARLFRRDGFSLKAAAMLKQALKLDPKLTAAREELVSIYVGLALKEEAIAEYELLLRDYATLERADDVARIATALAELKQSPDVS